MKCLFNYSPEEFLFNTKEFISTWHVRKGTIPERYALIIDSKRFIFFHSLISLSKIEANTTEIISWLDGMEQIYRIFDEIANSLPIEQMTDFFKNMHIIAEYHIPFNKNRIDYLITKDDKILLIEFSYCDNPQSKEHYKKKLNQIIYYQDLLKSSLSEHIKINIYTFLIKPEENNFVDKIKTKSKLMDEEVSPNFDERHYLKNLILHTFSKTKKTAYEELDILGDKYLYL